LPDETSGASTALLKDIMSRDVHMLVPDLWWYEMLNVLSVAVRRKRLTTGSAQKALLLLKEIPLQIVAIENMGLSAMLKDTIETSLSAYDGAYLHCALQTGSPLITADKDLLKIRKHYPFISSVRDY
jgi:predicted nucleic acid-binding protein